MTKDEVVQRITRLYADEANFLVQLRVNAYLDYDNFNEVAIAIRQYNELNRVSATIDKPVALFLFDMVVLLEGQIHQLKQFKHPLAEQVIEVREEAIRLFEETLKINGALC